MVSSPKAVSNPSRNRLGECGIHMIDPLKGDIWDEKTAGLEGCTIFHRSAWAKVLAETYGHRPFYLQIDLADQQSSFVPLMEVESFVTGRRGISLPFSDFAGPISASVGEAPEIGSVLCRIARERSWKYVEVRGNLARSGVLPVFRPYEQHQLDLRGGLDRVKDRVKPATRRAIRKALASEMVANVGAGAGLLDAFYKLHCQTRRRHGLPPQPISFFRAIKRHVLDQGLGIIVLASLGGNPVAGGVFFFSGRRALYKFGASIKRYWGLRPNHLVMWKAIEGLVAQGCHLLDFGRTSVHDKGLKQFKESWAGESARLEYHRFQSLPSEWVASRSNPKEGHPLIFGYLPNTFNRIAGRFIYPHLD
ncbi:lipid II:glycine glycyltransferase FemX [Haloferula sp.]|uniref:lipid II:glycine glycyltransferase FemX n=1 Tax=Haloferula sp. TaxID=2497595 RepID=UPI003C73BC30